MAKVYYRLIKDNKLAIEEVQERWRAATQALLDADTPQEGPVATTSIFDGMTVAQLKEYAATNDINLHGATRRVDIVAAIEGGI